MTALLYLLNVAGAAGQATCSKYFAARGGSVNLYNINKAAAALLVFFVVGLFKGISFHVPTILWGFGYGACMCVGGFAGFTALGLGPMALTSMIASFSLVIPFAVGITLWGETLSVWGVLGIILLVCLGIVGAVVYHRQQDAIDAKLRVDLPFYSCNGTHQQIQALGRQEVGL